MSNEIIADIHRHREALARACGYDVRKLMDHYRQRELQRDDAGHKLVSYVQPAPADNAAVALREESPKQK